MQLHLQLQQLIRERKRLSFLSLIPSSLSLWQSLACWNKRNVQQKRAAVNEQSDGKKREQQRKHKVSLSLLKRICCVPPFCTSLSENTSPNMSPNIIPFPCSLMSLSFSFLSLPASQRIQATSFSTSSCRMCERACWSVSSRSGDGILETSEKERTSQELSSNLSCQRRPANNEKLQDDEFAERTFCPDRSSGSFTRRKKRVAKRSRDSHVFMKKETWNTCMHRFCLRKKTEKGKESKQESSENIVQSLTRECTKKQKIFQFCIKPFPALQKKKNKIPDLLPVWLFPLHHFCVCLHRKCPFTVFLLSIGLLFSPSPGQSAYLDRSGPTGKS